MRLLRQCSIPAVAAPRKDTSGLSPATIGPGAGQTRRPWPTLTLRVAARSTGSNCSITIAASCNATGMPLTRRLPTPRGTPGKEQASGAGAQSLVRVAAHVSAKATIAEDIRYALNHWDGLTRFL